MRICDMRCKNMIAPVGINTDHIVFRWYLESQERNVMQKSYRIQLYKISSDGTRELINDTGVVESDNCLNVFYDGPDLEEQSVYSWDLTVEAESEAGILHAENQSFFETAIARESIQAVWIESTQPSIQKDENLGLTEMMATQEGETPIEKLTTPTVFFNDFDLPDKKIRKARAYATAHGTYFFAINGLRPDNRLLAPEFTSYQKTLLYQTYDVTNLLTAGKNKVEATVADGWWGGRLGMMSESCVYGDKHGFLMQIVVEYEDHSVIVMKTDGDWKCGQGPYCYSDMFVGEKFDATLSGKQYRNVKPVELVPYAMDNLCPQEAPPIRVLKSLPVKEILHTPRNEIVLDFGQNIAGRVRLRVKAEKGTEIKLVHSEEMGADGNFWKALQGKYKDQIDYYICAGVGEEEYAPEFTYHGFRYVMIQGLPYEPSAEDFYAEVITSESENTGEFKCSDERINRLYENVRWSQIANFISVPSDCPQREKSGYTGDAEVYIETALKNREVRAFFDQWLKSVRDDQAKNGAVGSYAPCKPQEEVKVSPLLSLLASDAIAGWGDAIVMVPWALYKHYGDKKILDDNWDAMAKWTALTTERAKNNPAKIRFSPRYILSSKYRSHMSHLWNTGFHFGDWLVPSITVKSEMGKFVGCFKTKEIFASGYHANTVKLMLEASKALGKTEEAKAYEKEYRAIVDAFVVRYLSKDGLLKVKMQGSLIMALAFDLIPQQHRKKNIDLLEKLLHENGDRLDTGFLSIGLIMPTLTDNGCLDLAYKLLYQEQSPSWLFEVKNGATTMWETWTNISENGVKNTMSYNHYAFGCVGAWLFETVAGIKNNGIAYKNIKIEPKLDDQLTYVECRQKTPYGITEVRLEKNSVGMELNVQIPCNTCAEIVLPNGQKANVGSGQYKFEV